MAITMRNTKAEMFAEIMRLQDQLAKSIVAPAPFVINTLGIPRTKPDMPQWQIDRAAQMAAAKAQAMSAGVVVKAL